MRYGNMAMPKNTLLEKLHVIVGKDIYFYSPPLQKFLTVVGVDFQVRQNRLQSPSERTITVISVHEGAINSNQVYSVNADPILKTTDSKCQMDDNKIIHIDSLSKSR